MTDLEIFHNAPVDASPEQLTAYLDEACGDVAELRAKVEALFSTSDQVVDFLEEPLSDPAMPNGASRWELVWAIIESVQDRADFGRLIRIEERRHFGFRQKNEKS